MAATTITTTAGNQKVAVAPLAANIELGSIHQCHRRLSILSGCFGANFPIYF